MVPDCFGPRPEVRKSQIEEMDIADWRLVERHQVRLLVASGAIPRPRREALAADYFHGGEVMPSRADTLPAPFLPPQNMEAEMALIGSVLLMSSAIDEVWWL